MSQKSLIMKQNNQVIVLGGGAAGYFCAINIKNTSPNAEVLLLEKTSSVLSKVRISGGGRCNVTNILSDTSELIKNYPRGSKELLGPFTRFSTNDTINWFEKRGVRLKTESDGRVFPVTNKSETIIELFRRETQRFGIDLITKTNITGIKKTNDQWVVTTAEKNYNADYLVISTGSSQEIWNASASLGHSVIPPVPSLFTFNIKDERLKDLSGVSAERVVCTIENTRFTAEGPLLITHWGLSGPAILKLSSFAAREINKRNYSFKLLVNWAPGKSSEEIKNLIEVVNKENSKKSVHTLSLVNIPLRLWERISFYAGIAKEKKWGELSTRLTEQLINEIQSSVFVVRGKSTFKEEFVTAGGISLKEINFRTMESRLHKNLFFAGEVLDIDALTGGFNFQAAWTTAWIAAQEIGERIESQKNEKT